jgi:hypothetical protein
VLLEIHEPDDPWSLLVRWFLPQTGGPLWRRDAVVDAGGWKPDQPCCQDYELYLRLLMHEKRFTYCPEAGAIYRQWSDDTVCNRDKSQTFRQRLAITQRAEDILRDRGELTRRRLRALSLGRFEAARQVWLFDPRLAEDIVFGILKSDPGFVPGGVAAPFHYRMAYRLLGFRAAERLSTVKRRLTSFASA